MDRRVKGRAPQVVGLALETATAHVEVAVCDGRGRVKHLEALEAGYGHTRELLPAVQRALAAAGATPRGISWVAADLGPGSFTGVRVGLATARALAQASGAPLRGACSLAALAHAAPRGRGLLVPLVPAGRRDLYAGFFRADHRGPTRLLAAPRVGDVTALLAAVEESRRLLGRAAVRFIGPGAARERAALETAYRGSCASEFRAGGLSAADLAAAALSDAGPASGLLRPGDDPRPLYVRSAQAEERVRRRSAAADPARLRAMTIEDVPRVAEVERAIFSDPWPEAFFRSELEQPMVHARIAELDERLAGYLVAWLGAGEGHLGNLATLPGFRRRGVASILLDDLVLKARARSVERVTLEVRVGNFAAQELYRHHGFRLVGLRRGYYRDTGEDALIMEWTEAGSR
jgi:tRNA threonylcarbamoyl adenosine modification protein YeaZ/ribosomal-protein-alanine acetyltransferase